MHHTHQLYSYNDMNIEFTIAGEGEPIFVFHGGHSNCHEELGYEELIQKGFSIITPSRAGYGKTTKEVGTSLPEACRHYVKLLDHLKIDRVHVLAISAGGPTGIQFAGQFPERVRTLTLQSAVTKEWLTRKDKEFHVASILFHRLIEKGTWSLISTMSQRFPRLIYKQMAPSFSNLSIKEVMARTTQGDIKQMTGMLSRQQSGHGFTIDLTQTSSVTADHLRSISCPTLIMHSNHDASVSIEHVKHAQKYIPSASLHMLDSWGHIIFLSETGDEVARTVSDFMNTYQ